jgi:hypothetical protein
MRKLIFLSTLIIFGCKDHPSFIEAIEYSVDECFFNLDVEFNNEIELNTELNIPVKDYGYVRLTPGQDDLGFVLGFSLNLKIIEDQEITKITRTNKLPNGQRMSRYVKKKLYKITINNSPHIKTSLYLGPDSEHLYLGTAIEIKAIDENFPEGLSLTTRIRDNKKRSLGSVTFFGPKIEDEKLENPGGFFFVSNVTDLLSYMKEDSSKRTKQHVILDKKLEITQNNHPLNRKQSRKIIQKILAKIKTINQENKSGTSSRSRV